MKDTSIPSHSSLSLPWYRYLWVWLIMLPPAAAVVGGLAAAWLAGGPPAMVVDDFGEIGRVSVSHAARDEHARVLGLQARLLINDASPAVLAAEVVARRDFDLPETLNLRFVHPTLAELDRQVSLRLRGAAYAGNFSRPPGRLLVQLSDTGASWRLVGELAPGANELWLGAR